MSAQEVKPGFKQTEAGVIPEGWQVVTLGDAVEFLDGRRRPVKNAERAKMKGEFPYYGASGIVDYVSSWLFDENLILLGEDGENILSRNLPLAFMVSGKIWVNNHAHVLRPNNDVEIRYLTEFLEKIDYSNHNSGTAQPKLNKRTCLRLPVVLPPLREQEAIAEALGDADALIDALERLLAKKRNLKQSVMHELLTGTRRLAGFGPTLRTKHTEIGAVPDDWTIKRLKSVTVQTATYGVVKAGAFQERGIPMLRGGDIKDGRVNLDIPYISEQKSAEYKRTVLKYQDVVIALVGYPGEAAVVPETLIGANISRAVGLLRPSNELSPHFLTSYLNSPIGRAEFLKPSAGSAQIVVNLRELDLLWIPLPPRPEQDAIATVLDDTNAEIATLEQKLTKAHAVKQGMMQQLLTGNVRLL